MIAAGIAVAAAAALANAFALVLQASEARRAPRQEAMRVALLRTLAHRRRWLAGTAVLLAAGALQVLALAWAPLAVVQPTLALSQLVLLALARIKLRERVGRPELLGALALVAGLSLVIAVSPARNVSHPQQGGVTVPLLVIGVPTVAAFLAGRRGDRTGLLLVIGAGLAYSWSDFAIKLLATDVSAGRWGGVILWVLGVVAFGALGFLEENSALQSRPAVTVAPVIGAAKVPLPVLMALWAGLERWGPTGAQVAGFLIGLMLVATGAAQLGSSRTVARVWSDAQDAGRPRAPMRRY